MVASRIANNLITLGVLGFIGWMIYEKVVGQDSLSGIKRRMNFNNNGGNNDVKFK